MLAMTPRSSRRPNPLAEERTGEQRGEHRVRVLDDRRFSEGQVDEREVQACERCTPEEPAQHEQSAAIAPEVKLRAPHERIAQPERHDGAHKHDLHARQPLARDLDEEAHDAEPERAIRHVAKPRGDGSVHVER